MFEKLAEKIKGDVEWDDDTRQFYSHDTSMFEIVPEAVVFPKDTDDVKAIVNFINENRKEHPSLSITGRSGGSDMSGGSINESLIVDFKRYMNGYNEVKGDSQLAQPGANYVDFEKASLESGMIFPSYPASRELCAIGGIVMNNAGGEKSLTYGKTEDYVRRMKVVLADGNEYEVRPLNKEELDKKMDQGDYEGNLYKQIYEMLEYDYDKIKAAKPNVTKNSTGYKLWDIWDRDKGIFDMTQLFVGSQGTLGMMTEVELGLVKQPKHSGVLVGYARDLEHMGEIIHILKKHNPTAIEAFDEHTVTFAFKFFLQFRHGIGWWGLLKMAIRLIPDAFILMRGMPRMIFMASFDHDEYDVIQSRINALRDELKVKHWRITLEEAENEAKSERFWMMRRKSFKLLRDNVKGGKHTAPYIDDIVVPSENIAKFWPEIKAILDKYDLLYTIAGHLGDGNFHIIPLMNLSDPKERAKIEPSMKEVLELVQKYDGVLSGEHNDGLIRSPFLSQMYGEDIFNLFKKTKSIFDPDNIFNPHKKTDADWQYTKAHMRDHF